MIQISDKLEVIGIIRSPFKTTDDVPHKCIREISEIEIYKDYEQGLKDIEGFSHIHVFYWLHKSKGYSLMVNTPWDETPHGLFTTRSPRRPNSIAHTIVELIKRNNNILRVKGLDAIDNTPVIDIKPYVKKMDAINNAISGWIEKTNLNLD